MLRTKQEDKAVAAYIEKEDATGCTALFRAVTEGNVITVKTLLAAKANVLSVDEDGWTPMHIAAANGYTSILRMLFAHNRKILEQRDNEGRTPLQRACYYGRKDAVEWLLDYNAAIESQDDKGKTPLHAAVSYARIFNKEVIELLVHRGAKLEASTNFGWTPLHSASRYGNAETVELLISLGAQMEAKNNYGETPLNFVAAEEKMDYEDKIPIINALLAGGANIHTQDNSGRTPLHWACILGQLSIVAILIKHNAVLDKEDEKGNTPLHYAAEGDHHQIVEYLISQKKQQEQTANIKPPSGMRVLAKTGIFSAISQNDNTSPNKFSSLPNKESVVFTNKLSSMDIKGEIDQDVFTKLSESSEINMLIQKQQTQINALCRLVQLQSTTIKEMEGNQTTMQAELEKLKAEQQIMRQELNQLKTNSPQAVSSRANFLTMKK